MIGLEPRIFLSISVLVVGTVVGCGADKGGNEEDQPLADDATQATAPEVGKADGQDTADTGCQVVLRYVESAFDNEGVRDVSHGNNNTWLTWTAHVDVGQQALWDGAQVNVLYHSSLYDGWWEAAGTEESGASPGFKRFTIRIWKNVAPLNTRGSKLQNLKIEMIPFLRMPDGSRRFDHNRNGGATENYWLTTDNRWGVGDSPTNCANR